jgi:hypothetical protein
MLQPVKEKIFQFKIGQMIEIDNMKFKIKEMYAHMEPDKETYSVSIWGNRPHATTISKDRIVRFENLFWKPRWIEIFTEKKGSIYNPFRNDALRTFLEDQSEKKDKVICIMVEMDTMLNTSICYDFDS